MYPKNSIHRVIFFLFIFNSLSLLSFVSTDGLFLSLRRSKLSYNTQVREAIKEFIYINDNPAVEFKTDAIVTYINQKLGGNYGTNEVLSILRELMSQGEIPEYFEVVDKHSVQPSGVLKQRDAVHRDGDWHLAVSVLVFDKEGNLLLQKRGATVAEPNRWEVSATGHIAPGETPQEAIIREIEEEIGIKVSAQNLINIGGLHRFIKIGRNDIKEDHFEGEAYLHYSDDPSWNQERLTLFMYIASDEEKKLIERHQVTGDVSGVRFANLPQELRGFANDPGAYSSAFAMYLSRQDVLDYLNHCFGQEQNGLTTIIKNGRLTNPGAGNNKFKTGQNNVPSTFQGISLVTDIEPDAKEELCKKLRELMNNPIIQKRVNFISEPSLHMTLADLITSEKLYGNPNAPVTPQERAELMERVIKPAFLEFANKFQGQGVDLKVKVDGIGMFPNGVLFFSVYVELNQFRALKALRDEIEQRLKQSFADLGKGPESLYKDYVTHITIGYLKPNVNIDPATDKDFLEVLKILNDELRAHPVEFMIREGKVVTFQDMNSFNSSNETKLTIMNFNNLTMLFFPVKF